MAQEVKRGLPTEPGKYDLLLTNGNVICCEVFNSGPPFSVKYLNGGSLEFGFYLDSINVVAHRLHEPLQVPPLTQLVAPEVRFTVIRWSSGSVVAVVCVGDRFYESSRSHALTRSDFKELTKEECEKLGFLWPKMNVRA